MGTGQAIAPIPVSGGIAKELRQIIGNGAASDEIDGDLRFKGRITFDHDQPRITRIRYVGTTILKPCEVAVVVDRVTKTDDRGRDILFMQVTNTSGTFSLEYIANGEKLLAPDDECDLSSFDSPIDLQYNAANTPAVGETWGPTATDGRLNKNYPGYRIDGLASNGRVRAVTEEIHALLGKTDGALANGASGTISVWLGGAGGSEVDSTWNVTAFNRKQAIPAGDWVVLVRVHGNWHVADTVSASGGTQSLLLGKTDAFLASAASGTISVWTGTPGSETDSTVNVTAYNKFGDVHSGAWVLVGHNGNGWYVASDCPACLLGKTDAAVAEGASVTVSVWGGTAGSETDTTANVTAWNRLSAIASGSWVLLLRVHSTWQIATVIPASGGIQSVLLCKADAAIARGASGTFSIWTGTPGSETDSTVNVTAYNRFEIILSGAWCLVANNGHGWYVVADTATGHLGKADAAIAVDASGTISIYSDVSTDTTLNVTAISPFGAIASAAWVWVAHNGAAYYAISEEC